MPASAHARRWITVVFVAPVLIAFFLKAPAYAVCVLASVVSALALWEYHNIFCNVEAPHKDFGYWMAVILSLIILAAALKNSFEGMFVAIWMTFLSFGARALIGFNRGKPGFEKLAVEALAILYIPSLMAALILIRCGEHGVTWLFFVLFLAFISDTGAFYGGRFFGKHKLIPKISPAKTVEGSLGSIAADLVVVTVFKFTVLTDISWPLGISVAVFAAVATQMGDLFESMLKRSFGAKDSGIFFPGHGGMLDRIDGMLFTGPVVYCFQLIHNYL
jgi:phosphatidate cytidylyltransferase